MQRFEITIDGNPEPGDYATQGEADAAALNARQTAGGKNVLVRPREDRVDGAKPGVPTEPKQDPAHR